VRQADIRFLYDFDRWATRRILAAADGVDETTWSAPNAIGDRGLGGILVHHLGSHQRWRHGLSGSEVSPRPEQGPLPSPAALAAWWDAEWVALDAWLDSLDDAKMDELGDGVPYWQMLTHVVNHGTQHRAEAAALLTTAGRSPGDLDMIDFSESQVHPSPGAGEVPA
jgi:uncharacterized damage-inducible protein DinB